MSKIFTAFAKSVARMAGKPITFGLSCIVIVIWAAVGPVFAFSDTWQLVINTSTTIITFLMVFLIQNTQNRDGAAIQAKLDELLRSHRGARNEFIGIENLTDNELGEIIVMIETEAQSVKVDPEMKAKLMRMHAGLNRIVRTRSH